MNIKNKFSLEKIDADNVKLNKKLKLKGKIRLFTSKIVPLNETEKFLFLDEHKDYNSELPMMDKNKYIRISNIYLLNFISKANCENLFNGIINLSRDNPLKGYLGGEIKIKELKDCIMSFSRSSNEQRWNRLCEISPYNDELYKYCDYITISLFEASNDFMGINFEMRMTDKFNNEVNKILNSIPTSEKTYHQYNYKSKKIYSVSHPRIDYIRNSDYEDLLLEIKDRFNKLFNKYLPLELSYEKKAPISFNIYQTNYDLSIKDSWYFNSLDLLKEYSRQEKKDKRIYVTGSGRCDKDIKTKMWYEISIESDKVDRSNNLFFYVKDKNLRVVNDGQEFTNFTLSTLTYYELEEMIQDISVERNKLYNCPYKKIKKNHIQYEQLNYKMQRYRMIFNGLKCHNIHYSDEYLIKGFEFLSEKYRNYYSQYEELNKEYKFRMEINNSKSSFSFSKLSIAIAVLALLLTVFFEYRKDKNICDKCEFDNEKEIINNVEMENTYGN